MSRRIALAEAEVGCVGVDMVRLGGEVRGLW